MGVHPRPLLDRSRDVADVTLDDVTARRLDVDADAALDEMATRAAVLVAADALGTCERMLQLAVDYSKQRQQFGQPIGAFQAVKHAAAQMLVTVESSMSIAFYAAQSVEEGLPDAVGKMKQKGQDNWLLRSLTPRSKRPSGRCRPIMPQPRILLISRS